jgi:hypothetical protein
LTIESIARVSIARVTGAALTGDGEVDVCTLLQAVATTALNANKELVRDDIDAPESIVIAF